MNQTELLLIDLSSIAHPIFHMSGNEPDPNWTSAQIVARVHALSTQHPHAAICCDAPRSFRHDLAPRTANGDGSYSGYKANRPERDARLMHQIETAIERLRADGYPIWKADGFEADDVIATATARALAIDADTSVLIATADKDLLQLVTDRVRVKNVAPQSKGDIRDVAAVVERFGIAPPQMLDWLCLVGDTSDNVKGAKGIGDKNATALLKAHGSLDALYAEIDKGVVAGVTLAMRTNLQEFRARWPLTRQLIALRSDVAIPFEEIATEREAKPMEDTVGELDYAREQSADIEVEAAPKEQATNGLGGAVDTIGAKFLSAKQPETAVVPYAAPLDYSQQLEPRSMPEAVQLAQRMFESRLFSAYGTPQAVLATVLAGRELGIPAMASLRAFHIIEGKPQLSAGAIQSLVLKSGKAKTFRCTERTATKATFVTQRGDDPEMALSYTIEEGRAAFVGDDAKWAKSGWGRNPADMLVARASSKLARLVYPDVVSGLYAPEELD